MLELLIAKLWPYLLGAVAIVVGWFMARQQGKTAARTEDAAKINKTQAKAGKEVRDVQNTVAKMGDDPVADKLKSDWVRGDKSRH